jgi:DNA (cytosine-5)-methyltransferase 1
MTVGSLFAGIGGFDLGFERAGFEIKWQVEIDEYCRRVLAKHWPHVKRYDDVRRVHKLGLSGYACGYCLERVDVICGGFPCQDISDAGAGAGIDAGERSGLWREMARIIGELRPRYVVVENVSALLHRGMGRVLGDLADIGYDAEWDCIPAAALGAGHLRERIWIVAYPAGERRARLLRGFSTIGLESPPEWSANALDTSRTYDEWARGEGVGESPLLGTDDGLSEQVGQLTAFGNSVLPQIPEWIAHRIKEAERLTA